MQHSAGFLSDSEMTRIGVLKEEVGYDRLKTGSFYFLRKKKSSRAGIVLALCVYYCKRVR